MIVKTLQEENYEKNKELNRLESKLKNAEHEICQLLDKTELLHDKLTELNSIKKTNELLNKKISGINNKSFLKIQSFHLYFENSKCDKIFPNYKDITDTQCKIIDNKINENMYLNQKILDLRILNKKFLLKISNYEEKLYELQKELSLRKNKIKVYKQAKMTKNDNTYVYIGIIFILIVVIFTLCLPKMF